MPLSSDAPMSVSQVTLDGRAALPAEPALISLSLEIKSRLMSGQADLSERARAGDYQAWAEAQLGLRGIRRSKMLAGQGSGRPCAF